jgi:hypothetical protein
VTIYTLFLAWLALVVLVLTVMVAAESVRRRRRGESLSERHHRLDEEARQAGIQAGFDAGWHTTSRRAR